jgi:hypothetical protein
MNPEIVNKKWFEKKWLLLILLFILPPLGIYGVLKRNPLFWKKLVYTFFASFMILYWIGLFGMLMFPINHYEDGLSKLQNGNLQLAIQDFEKVDKTDVNYSNALNQINLANQKLNEQNLLGEKLTIDKKVEQNKFNEKLIEFQKKWSDSVVKSNKGSYILSSKLSLPDTICFELSKAATKSFNSNRSDNLPMYVSIYKRALNNEFGNIYNSVKTVIDFIPNKELSKNNNSAEWSHPVLMNKGLKIYSGNQYSKEYLGALKCKYNDETDGNTYYIIVKDNGNETRIEDYQFRTFYWIKRTDPNYNNTTGISKCY